MTLPLLDLEGLNGTDIAAEFARLLAGEPWYDCGVAGLQYYDYGQPGLDELPILPCAGDRVALVRAPDNLYDPNAVEVWWRNDTRLGHLPRGEAGALAGQLDAGIPLRAYCIDGGNGDAWSVGILMVGPAVREIYERRHGVRQLAEVV